MKSLLLIGILAAGASSAADEGSLSSQPFKLEIHRHVASGHCTLAALDNTQHHKGLRGSAIVEESGLSLMREERRTGELEYLLAYSYDIPLLWKKADDLCGPRSAWLFRPTVSGIEIPISFEEESSQFVILNHDGHNAKLPHPPPLDVIPLSMSGNSSNRVDITFFGDGCEFSPFFVLS